jgi:hypothetical protein
MSADEPLRQSRQHRDEEKAEPDDVQNARIKPD